MSGTQENAESGSEDRGDSSTPPPVGALVHLLGDDNPKVVAAVWDQLERLGVAAVPEIRNAAATATDARVRAKARRFLRELERREVFQSWVGFCRDGATDLEEGAFLIARSEYPNMDPQAYRTSLDECCNVFKKRLVTVRSVDSAVGLLSHLIHVELGFKGNSSEYYDPDNTYLNRVLDRKLGIPISLATVYLLMARRLSLPLYGVSMPQHFLLKYRGSHSEVFVDAFRGGQRITARDCAAFLKSGGVAFDEAHLEAVGDQEILRRTLANLIRIYHSKGDERRLGRVSAMVRLLD